MGNGSTTLMPNDSTSMPAIQRAPRPRFLARVWADLNQNPAWTKWTLACAFFWSVQIFWMQVVSLHLVHDMTWRHLVFYSGLRLVFDVVFCVGLSLCLPRVMVMIATLVAALCSIGLVVYADYFNQPLSILTLYYQQSEGMKVSEYAIKLIPWGVAIGFVALMALSWFALFRVRRPRFRWSTVGTVAGGFLFVFLGLSVFANQIDPLSHLMNRRGVARIGLIRGYLGTWAGEWYYLTDSTVLQKALERRKDVTNNLTPIEANIPVGDKVVEIQCESLDFHLLDYAANGKVLTPFLNELKKRSMFYRIRANHRNGTADADFAGIVGYPPSSFVITYNIPKYPYDNTFPQQMKKYGFQTQSLHGYFGSFYNRRFAFRKIGFDKILFQEELHSDYGLPVSKLGVLDADVLGESAALLKETPGRVFQFIITLSTHGPFDSIPESERKIYLDHPSLYENYFNSINYLDRSLANWYDEIPTGTTVMLYGDQAADQDIGDFHADRSQKKPAEYTPCLIFKKGDDFSKLQKTRDLPIAFNGDLSLIDLVWYFRGQMDKTFGHAAQGSGSEAQPAAQQPAGHEPPAHEPAAQ